MRGLRLERTPVSAAVLPPVRASQVVPSPRAHPSAFAEPTTIAAWRQLPGRGSAARRRPPRLHRAPPRSSAMATRCVTLCPATIFEGEAEDGGRHHRKLAAWFKAPTRMDTSLAPQKTTNFIDVAGARPPPGRQRLFIVIRSTPLRRSALLVTKDRSGIRLNFKPAVEQLAR